MKKIIPYLLITLICGGCSASGPDQEAIAPIEVMGLESGYETGSQFGLEIDLAVNTESGLEIHCEGIPEWAEFNVNEGDSTLYTLHSAGIPESALGETFAIECCTNEKASQCLDFEILVNSSGTFAEESTVAPVSHAVKKSPVRTPKNPVKKPEPIKGHPVCIMNGVSVYPPPKGCEDLRKPIPPVKKPDPAKGSPICIMNGALIYPPPKGCEIGIF